MPLCNTSHKVGDNRSKLRSKSLNPVDAVFKLGYPDSGRISPPRGMVMTANVKKTSLKNAVPVITPVDGRMYWIQRTTNGGNTLEPEVAQFHKIEIGMYPGKWQIFDRVTKVYHDPRVRILSEIAMPSI